MWNYWGSLDPSKNLAEISFVHADHIITSYFGSRVISCTMSTSISHTYLILSPSPCTPSSCMPGSRPSYQFPETGYTIFTLQNESVLVLRHEAILYKHSIRGNLDTRQSRISKMQESSSSCFKVKDKLFSCEALKKI